jgi:hypothetical protein
MKHQKLLFLLSFCLLLLPGFKKAQELPQIQEEVIVRWWLVPVYATDKAGLPILNLSPEDLEIYIGGRKVDSFSLHKKKFEVTETQKPKETPAQPAQQPAQKKMVFLIFDAAFSPYNLLAKAKSIARTVIAQSDRSARYVLMSIEPFSGLHYIYGPTQDLKLLSENMEKYIAGKKADYLTKSSEVDSSNIRSPYPGRSPVPGYTGDRPRRAAEQIDRMDKRRMASAYTSSLMTLNLVLGLFRDFSKVVYLYSCGIPSGALVNRAAFPVDTTDVNAMNWTWYVYLSPDMVSYNTLKLIGEYLNKSGALLFIVNPAGTRVLESDWDSGEQSLRILASESGGKYFEGTEKNIAKEVNQMEGGYYEISFPDKTEYEGQEMSFEIQSKRPDAIIYTVRKVGRSKDYMEMTPLEQEVLVLNILNEGPYAQVKQKVLFVEAQAQIEDGEITCLLPLPPELGRSEWDVFKVWRDFESGTIEMEKDRVVAHFPGLEIRMKMKKKDFRRDIVVVHSKTGTIVVWK